MEKINIDQFINIKSKEIAYILGLIWADGHVTFSNNNAKTPIVKHTSKVDDNQEFYNILLKSGNWKTFTSDNIGSYAKTPKKICTNWISSRLLGEFLIDNDYKNKTKSPDKILKYVPYNLKHYWFRGFFDGDGSVTIIKGGHHSIAFTSCENQDWFFIEDLFKSINIQNYKIRIISSRGGKSSQIRITNRKDIKIFENYLYNNYDIDKLGLYRKRVKFESL